MRPMSEVRQALMRALDAGAAGTFDALAAVAGVPQDAAQATLWNLSREGRVQRVPVAADGERRRGRRRLVYAKPATPGHDLAAVLCAGWR